MKTIEEIKKLAEKHLKPSWSHLYIQGRLMNRKMLPTSYQRELDTYVAAYQAVQQEMGNGWVSVETPPKTDGSYLVFGIGYIAPYVDFYSNDRFLDEDVTYWMPLPEPPENNE